MSHIMNDQLDPETQSNVDRWLNENYDPDTKSKIRKLQNDNPEEIIDAFYKNLTFGTGGLRGIMGVGCNRINFYTVRAATQGVADYLNSQTLSSHSSHKVLIGYDSRHNSRAFAEEAAKVLAGNKINVLLFKDIRPVPLISFGCRYKKCSAAIMITASHNPAQYNGYKIYWSDGAQVLSPHENSISKRINQITDLEMIKSVSSIDDVLIEEVDDEMD
nr:phospho-sugar mutase [Parachlamydiaceae bacterium]